MEITKTIQGGAGFAYLHFFIFCQETFLNSSKQSNYQIFQRYILIFLRRKNIYHSDLMIFTQGKHY